MRRLGVHTSIAGGLQKSLERAKELECNTLQIFSHNPRGWAVKEKTNEEITHFKKLRNEFDISPVFIHTSYLINLASQNKSLLKKSIDMIVQEMNLADSIGAEYAVLHTGSASGDDPVSARKRAASCLKEISEMGQWRGRLLLENTAGEQGDITTKIKDIAEIMEELPFALVSGVCIDTCHAFSAGYDIRNDEGIGSIACEIDKYIGKDKVRLLHFNDSKGLMGAGLDRHEHIGEGKIGKIGLKKLLNHPFFADVPVILETPKKSEDDDRNNLAVVRKMLRI
jgi:deoxyribonuclease IV